MPEFRQATLSSGLRVVAEIDPRSYSAAFGYFVRAGARDEVDRESGLSHFLEHMMFKGTAKRTAADVNRQLDELGGQSNAYTTEEQTVYYATVLPKFQDRIVDLLSDMLSPSLDPHEFETERQVILEEIAKYDDQPPFGAFERAMEVHFGPRGLGRRVLGTEESIRTMRLADVRDYFQRRYRPENVVLAATGHVDFEGLLEQVETLSALWQTRQLPAPPPVDDAGSLPPGISLERTLEIPDANQAYLVRIASGPSSISPDRYAARILASIVGEEGGSRMFWDLIDTGRAEIATVWSHEFSDCGAWFTYLSCAPEDIAANRQLLDDLLQHTAESGVEQAEFDQAINKTIAGYIMQSERPSNRLFSLGSRWLSFGEYISTDETLARLRALDVDAVSQAARLYLGGDNAEILASTDLPVTS
jgi:predicted Zn-dependent peptidase